MAYAALEDFESYSNGDTLPTKNGGSGWSGAWVGATNGTSFVIQNSVVSEGSLALKFDGVAQTGEGLITRTMTGVTAGIARVRMRRSLVTGSKNEMSFTLRTATPTSICYTQFQFTGAIVNGGLAATTITTGVADTWYLIDTEFDMATDQTRGRVDCGTWTSWQNFIANRTGTTVGAMYLSKDNAGTGTAPVHYWDAIADGDATCPTPPTTFIPKIMMS
jgi:hypothetical protein